MTRDSARYLIQWDCEMGPQGVIVFSHNPKQLVVADISEVKAFVEKHLNAGLPKPRVWREVVVDIAPLIFEMPPALAKLSELIEHPARLAMGRLKDPK